MTQWQRICLPMEETQVQSLAWEDPMEKGIANHSTVLARRILWTEEPGRLQSIGLHRVGHDWSDLACMHALEKEMATHSSVLAWRVPRTEEPGGLPSMGLHRVGHNWSDLAAAAAVKIFCLYFFFRQSKLQWFWSPEITVFNTKSNNS